MTCSICTKSFTCNADTGQCWCMEYPVILDADAELNGCMCEACLNGRIKAEIQKYVAGTTPENALANQVKNLPKTAILKEDIDYYIENGLYVFTAWFHLKRGECCKNGCRHCPYGFKK